MGKYLKMTLLGLMSIIFLFGVVGAVLEWVGGSDAAGERGGSRAGSGYLTDSEGLVSSILDDRFFIEEKKIYFERNDRSGLSILLENNRIRVCSSVSDCSSSLALDDGIGDEYPLCRGTDLNEGVNRTGIWISICTLAADMPVRESSVGAGDGYRSSDVIPKGYPVVMIDNFDVAIRRRFYVEGVD